jgi:hypothetical protein
MVSNGSKYYMFWSHYINLKTKQQNKVSSNGVQFLNHFTQHIHKDYDYPEFNEYFLPVNLLY